MIRELDFNSIRTDHSQVEKKRAPSPGHDLWGMEIVLEMCTNGKICMWYNNLKYAHITSLVKL